MTQDVKARRKRKKLKPKRKSFLIDHETLTDLGVVQNALRATSSAEALRVSVRKMAEMVRAANRGLQFHAVDPAGITPPVCLDIPHLDRESVNDLG